MTISKLFTVVDIIRKLHKTSWRIWHEYNCSSVNCFGSQRNDTFWYNNVSATISWIRDCGRSIPLQWIGFSAISFHHSSYVFYMEILCAMMIWLNILDDADFGKWLMLLIFWSKSSMKLSTKRWVSKQQIEELCDYRPLKRGYILSYSKYTPSLHQNKSLGFLRMT